MLSRRIALIDLLLDNSCKCQGFFKEIFRTVHRIQRCCVSLADDRIELPAFGEKE